MPGEQGAIKYVDAESQRDAGTQAIYGRYKHGKLCISRHKLASTFEIVQLQRILTKIADQGAVGASGMQKAILASLGLRDSLACTSA